MLAAAFACGAQEPVDLADLSLEELASIEVTSVTRRTTRLSSATTSIYVITADDIRWSGVTSLPEVLRLAPNLQVARRDSAQYAISARGFNGSVANKLLVLIDGRTVYTPLFSGVFWDAQDVLIEDIERVEVISGPGGVLWGTNAVNGVINVITKSAADTGGALLVGDAGSDERGVAVRYGGSTGGRTAYRLYGKFYDWDDTDREAGGSASDAWRRWQVGFRGDRTDGTDQLTFQGDAYDGTRDQPAPGEVEISGANLLLRWTRELGDEDRLQLQSYVDYVHRDIAGTFAQDLRILDAEFHHFFRPVPRHGLTWGGGYRHADDEVTNSAGLAFLPAERTLNWANLFVQDEIAWYEDRVTLTLGARYERNPFTDWEFLPSARLGWQTRPGQLLWSAVSRAVRAPSRIDREFFVPGEAPFLIAGGPDFRSETADVLELGFRFSPTQDSTVSMAVFYTDYDRLRSLDLTPGGTQVIANSVEGTTSGVEFWGSLAPAGFWRLHAGIVYLDKDLEFTPGSTPSPGFTPEGDDPEYQWMLRSTFDLPHDFDLYLNLRGVGSLPDTAVPGYTELDARLAWHASAGVELSLVGRNLLDGAHPEFGSAAARSEIPRSVQFRVRWSP